MYMLDTNILIFALRHPNSPVVDRMIHFAMEGTLCISAVTYGELEVGIMKSSSPEKSRRALEAILAGIPTISYDQDAAACYAQLRAKLEKRGMPVDDPDLMIAGNALATGCTLVTNNRKHFDRMEIYVEDWLEGLR